MFHAIDIIRSFCPEASPASLFEVTLWTEPMCGSYMTSLRTTLESAVDFCLGLRN